MKNMLLQFGDCLEILPTLAAGSIDMILTDLPYGTTACKWDSIIPLDKLWIELNRVCKLNAAMVFTAQQPFTWKLCASNPANFKYEWIWEKPNGTSPFAAKTMPMKKHETILVFFRKQPTYNPQMETGKPYVWNSKRSKGEAGGITGKNEKIDNKGTRYPSSIIKINQERGLHPTQKPVGLLRYLIRTYSNSGDTILDCTMGSGSTGIASMMEERNFVGIENELEYFNTALARIEEAKS